MPAQRPRMHFKVPDRGGPEVRRVQVRVGTPRPDPERVPDRPRVPGAVDAGTWSLRSWPHADPDRTAELMHVADLGTFVASEPLYWRATSVLHCQAGAEVPVARLPQLIGHSALLRVRAGLPEVLAPQLPPASEAIPMPPAPPAPTRKRRR